MNRSRFYIPSAALIRALARPQPLRCPSTGHLPAQFVRCKKTKAAKARDAEKARLESEARKQRHKQMTDGQSDADALKASHEQMMQEVKKDKRLASLVGPLEKMLAEQQDPERMTKRFIPPVFKEGEEPPINIYETDYATGKRTKVKLGSVAEQKKRRKLYLMLQEWSDNPDYDSGELDKRMIEGLMADPAFAELAEDLKEIKDDIMTREEIQKAEEQAQKEAQPAMDEIGAALRTTIHESLTELMNDPDIGDERADLQAVLDKLPEVEDFEDPEFQALMDKATEKVNKNPKLQAKLSAASENETPEEKEQWATFQKEIDGTTAPEYNNDTFNDEEVDELILEMRDILKKESFGSELDKELDEMLSDVEGQMNLLKLEEAQYDTDNFVPEPNEDENEEDIKLLPPELAAQIDRIIADPRIMERLDDLSKLIDEHRPQRDPNDLTQIDAELAPDPYEMAEVRTATLAQRMAAARADPEHATALRNLRVKLHPSYNDTPALKLFNQAIAFAYVGANDDVRRVLWRSYQKARALPTFLHNLSDDAWDILYYSQAVTWTGNQNKTDHLKELLQDLATTGRSGPPTHPSTLGQVQEAARLEAAQREQREDMRGEREEVDATRV